MYSHYDKLPDGFITVRPEHLAEILPGPSLIELKGRRQPALFVSILLHGNEPVGLQAMQQVLATYSKDLPRDLVLFVGNVKAAQENIRRLHDQPDYNRIWPGTIHAASPETRMMASLMRRMQRRGLFASIDIHNNTGRNPHYSCITRTDPATLQLASLFGRTALLIRTPPGTQTAAFAPWCPAITLECARPYDEAGVQHAAEFVTACLKLDHLPQRWPDADDLHLFEIKAVVKVPAEVSFGFGNTRTALCFDADLDLLNFNELQPGHPFARIHPGQGRIVVLDETGHEVTYQYFREDGDLLRVRQCLTLAMLTQDPNAIRLDCLGYIMARRNWQVDTVQAPHQIQQSG